MEPTTSHFLLKESSPCPKPKLNLHHYVCYFGKSMPTVCLHTAYQKTANSAQPMQRIGHFGKKAMLIILSCCCDSDPKSSTVSKVHTVPLMMFSAWRMTCFAQSERFRAGSRWPTPCLGFRSVMLCWVVCEWVDGKDRTSLVTPGWSPSARRVNWVICSEASSWQCPRKSHGSSFLVFSSHFFPFLPFLVSCQYL